MAVSANSDRLDQRCRSMTHPEAEKLLGRLNVEVEDFAVGEVAPDGAHQFPAINKVIVIYVVRGQGTLESSDGTLALAEGMIAVIPSRIDTVLRMPGQDLAVDSDAGNAGADATGSDNKLVVASSVVTAHAGHGLGYFQSLREPLVEKSDDPVLAAIFGGILTEMETPGLGSNCIVNSLMKQVLIVLLRRTMRNRNIVSPLYLTIASPSLAKVINAIHDNHTERQSLPGLARMVGMTSLGLTREFDRVFGESLLDYIQSVRLTQAASLLVETNLPVKSIAAAVGFASRSHFSRAFRKHEGEDPTTYRKINALWSFVETSNDSGQTLPLPPL